MKKGFILLAALCCLVFVGRAERYSSLWQVVSGPVPSTGTLALHPDRFLTFASSETSLRSLLSGVSADADHPFIIDIPQPDGSFRAFRIWKNDLLPEALAAKYPGILTFTAEAVNNRSVTAKIEYTPFGFHAYIFDGSRTFLVDPYSTKADGYYISYYRSDYQRPVSEMMHCEQVGELEPTSPSQINLTQDGLPDVQYRLNGGKRKKYMLALAADSEYCAAVVTGTPTKAAVLAKMVVSVNRVSGVYERELSVTLQLVPNDDTLIFLGADPYTNNNGGTMLGQNQTVVTARIGSGNYDIGHVFSTGGGGIASLGCVCNNNKAQGVTGSQSPVGDAFDIDYVAHEMGHQFGAPHTFNNNNAGSCAGNASFSHAYEPGSGSTIMAYAGICGSTNDYQPHSDPIFHSVSLEDISAFITTGSGRTCPDSSVSTNLNATLPAFTAIYNIPAQTPFELMAPAAVDATADTVLYAWEERDLGKNTNPKKEYGYSIDSAHFTGPMFKPFAPTSSRNRVFPEISKLLNNITFYRGEKLPDSSRYLRFKLVERDYYQGFGCFNFPDDTIHLDVLNTGAPFAVTYPNAASDSWTGSPSGKLVTWDVSGTDAAPISTSAVDIFLSIDGGYTYPYTLALGRPNTGTATVSIPSGLNSTTARVKVKGAGNVFFNISKANFTVLTWPTDVSTVPAAQLATIAPNPAQNTLSITIPSGTLTGRISNTLGQSVWSGILTGTQSLNISSWARGIYYLELFNTANGTKATQKIAVD